MPLFLTHQEAVFTTAQQWLIKANSDCSALLSPLGPGTELRKAGPSEKRKEASLTVEVLVHFQRVQSP